jgi:Zn-dependent protease with chaperone function
VAFIAWDQLANRPVIPLPAPPSTLPGRAVGWRALAVALGLYTMAAVIALTAVPGDLRLEIALGLLIVLAVDVPLIELMRGISARRVRTRLARTAPTAVGLPAGVTAVAARYGVRELTTRMQVTRSARDRAYRVGRRAWIVLGAGTIHSGEFRSFVLCHEIGHVVRDDSRVRRITFIVAAAIILVTGLSAEGPSLAVAIAATLLAFVADHWIAELACDAFAVRWTGVEPFRAWATLYRQRLRLPANRRPGRRLRRGLGLLSHPPMGLRLRWAERVAARAHSS